MEKMTAARITHNEEIPHKHHQQNGYDLHHETRFAPSASQPLYSQQTTCPLKSNHNIMLQCKNTVKILHAKNTNLK